MALYAVAGGPGAFNVDLTGLGKGKRIASWSFSNTGAAAVINIRDGSVSGTPYIKIGVAANDSKALAYSHRAGLPLFVNGVFVEVASGTIVGSVDLV